MPWHRLRLAAVAASICTLGACTSLSPQVSRSAADYSTVMEDFNNQVLMVNVLRARDQTPLNFSDLPIIHGSISEQASLSALAMFGGVAGTTARSSLSPGVQFSSSPTFDTSSLNNEAFVLNMLQPVSPAYMESIWHGGYSKELLLNLFVESIRLPSTRGNGESLVFYNNPDVPNVADYQDFQRVVHALAVSGANLRSFTVLDPVGPPLMSESRSADGKPYVPTSSASVYTAMTGLDPSLYQIGNVKATTMVHGKAAEVAGFQVYRRNTSQVGLCVDSDKLRGLARQMRASDAGDALAAWLEGSADDLLSLSGSTLHPALALYGGRSSGRGATPMSHATKAGRASASAGQGNARASASTVRTESHAIRTTGILDRARECGTEEHIATMRSETDEVKDTARLGYVRWRSPMDVYNYLGALLRNSGNAARTPVWTDLPGGPQHLVFQMVQGRPQATPGEVLATVNYRGTPYTVIGRLSASDGDVVHSLQVLSLLSQLVNISKLSNDIPVTRSIEVLP